MLRPHRGHHPVVHPDAHVAPTAVLAGQVTLGAGAAVLDGAVITAESAPVEIGAESIVMENAVVRGAGSHPAHVGRHTLIGPGAHVTGARIGDECMIATHASVFNGARLADGVLVAIGAIVHVGTRLAEGARLPMQHIAVGDPAEIFPPERAPEAHQAVERIGFTRQVFGRDTGALSFRETMAWLCTTYAGSLRRHAQDPTPGP
ncbi:gamma carbonic anhydrase family protein [Streptomyces hoynatensis]|uniref:Gamma carbonic anhydrase family protein n=1 Tax=Streptomyces hoynatensis TaxID=1141874 RepID=A0A3A9Z488_9ACTN|nr:gamma carbonic anhydrase family protein [Streptomyces hoynatensis]RKN43040.1 gamma carbonic anhydrase family protein [Streptomyces hoynatensis]